MEEQNPQAGNPENQSNSNQEGLTPSLFAAALQREHRNGSDVLEALGETTIIVPRAHCRRLYVLKSAPGLNSTSSQMFADLIADPKQSRASEVNYHLFSTTKFHRVRLKVLLNEDDAHVPTVTGVWRTANWHERETYDLFGVVFDDHPDLRRILLPDDWQGHALRKDFPLRGYEPYSLE
jgi:NADH-quinone oxidoreductase subunit C